MLLGLKPTIIPTRISMISVQSNDDFMLLVLWLFNTCERNPFSGIKIRNILLQDVIFYIALLNCPMKRVERHCRIILLLCVWAKLWLRVEASSKEALRAGDLQIKLQVTMSRDSSNLHRPPWLSGGGDLCWIATTQRSSGRFHLNRLFATWDCNGWTILLLSSHS